MNLTALARAAGVSVATVSKAFSGSREISEETKARIFAIARKAGCFDRYNKNKFGKHVIAVICPELASEYYSAIATLLNREITAAGGVMVTSVSGFDADNEKELFEYYASYCHADGIILMHQSTKINNAVNTPAVAFSSVKMKNIDNITLDLSGAIEDAVLHLKELGHTEIGFAGELLTGSKQEAFCSAMRRAALPVQKKWLKVSHARFEQAGVEIAAEWLREGTLPTAVFAAYDYIAIGIIKHLQAAGVRVPEDVSVVGMDDISVAPYLSISLSSIRTHTEEACRRAVALVMKKIENKYYSVRESIVIPAEFIARESSGGARR